MRNIPLLVALVCLAGCNRSAAELDSAAADVAPVETDQPLDTSRALPTIDPGDPDTSPAGSSRALAGIDPRPPDTSRAETSSAGWTAGVVRAQKFVDGVATVVATRTATHAAYDRFVIELAGNEIPSYHVEYVDEPVRQCGSGEPIRVAGDGQLLVRLEPARAHNDEGEATLQDRRSEPRLPNLFEIRLICDFEAHVEWVLGVGSPNEFRVLELADPARLVVDIRR